MTVTDVVLHRAQTEIQRPQSAVEIRAAVNLIQEVMKEVMKDGVHYGTIPGTKKPSLYKPGSEKILSTFRIAIDPEVQDLSTPDEARFRVFARATSMASDAHLGSGVGECSSNEEKYRWRAAICDQEWDETPEDRRRSAWKRGKNNSTYKVKQVRVNPADVANTVLKMAKKRAQIDVTLTATAASDVFNQDIEDLPEGLREVIAAEEIISDDAPTITPPQRRSEAPPQEADLDIASARLEITRLLVSRFPDPDSAADYLESLTENKEKGWKGKREVSALTEKGVQYVLNQLRRNA